jgi:hypothetical protein
VHPRGRPKKIYFAGGILKEFFAGDKAKLAYFAGVKTYLPFNIWFLLYFFVRIEGEFYYAQIS